MWRSHAIVPQLPQDRPKSKMWKMYGHLYQRHVLFIGLYTKVWKQRAFLAPFSREKDDAPMEINKSFFPKKAPFSIGDAFRFYPTNKESEKTGGKANTRWEINRDLGISGSAIPGTRDSKRKRDYNRLLKPNCVSLSENDIWITYRHAKQQRKREGKRERKREAIYSSETWRQLG